MLAARLHAVFYHGELTHEERHEMIAAWSENESSLFIVATSSLSAGLHYPFVRKVIHVDALDGLLNYDQETGRVDRDELPAVCLTLLAVNWTVSWDQSFKSDFLSTNRQEMTRFLHGRFCLRQQLTTYLNGGKGIACSTSFSVAETRLRCSVCSTAISSTTHSSPFQPTATQSSISESTLEPPRSPSMSTSTQDALDEALHALTSNVPAPIEASSSNTSKFEPHALLPAVATPSEPPSTALMGSKEPDDLELGIESHSDDCTQSSEDSSSSDEDYVYNVAAQLARIEVIDREAGFDLYEERIVEWGQACIPCSFHRRELIEGPHSDCLQNVHRSSLNDLRRKIRIKAFMGCYNCGHMQAICPRRGQKGGCMQPWLAWHVAWTAYHLDVDVGRRMILLLEGPDLTDDVSSRLLWLYCHWLGRETKLFDRPTSNMGRLLYHWLDRLEDYLPE